MAQKAGDRYLFFLEFRRQINSIAPVGVDFPVAITVTTNGTYGTNISNKMGPV